MPIETTTVILTAIVQRVPRCTGHTAWSNVVRLYVRATGRFFNRSNLNQRLNAIDVNFSLALWKEVILLLLIRLW